jgi:hypothetical protein
MDSLNSSKGREKFDRVKIIPNNLGSEGKHIWKGVQK